ncbi:WD40 repeat-like protein [Dendrothele bispora CBS 962.96]|uniref:WD40 repeat-like protein n=1 Tax=Dendrothele bispora (strain CBS 962.96) TaxID=1314807 RepID=A0A4S8LY67_DENBC|nr:WD40 repeat-like protein [Dendrothele bispora CBS 962.96]
MGRKTQRMKAFFSCKKKKSNVQNVPASQTGSQISVSPSPSSNRGQAEDVALDAFQLALNLVKESADWFGPLKAAAGGLCECIRIYRQVADNKDNFDKLAADIAERANILEQERKKGISSDMEEDFNQLSEKLKEINAQVKMKKDQHIALQVVQGDQINKDIDSFYKEVQDAYQKCKDQVLFTIGRDTREIVNILKDHIIQNTHYSQKAFHYVDIGNGHARTGCTPGTRKKVLKDIEKWADGTSPVKTLGYWICGMAGTGKSTIAKSVCNTMETRKMLAASFFCSRQIPECRDQSKIIPTIVYQMAQFSPIFGRELVTILQGDPNKISRPPSEQLEMLLVEPWMKVVRSGAMHSYTSVIIIDALDECENIESVLCALIPAIQNQRMPGLKFLFTSRPENHIYNDLNGPRPPAESQVEKMYLHNVEESLVQADIAKYLLDKLQNLDIAQSDMEKLVESSGKLFIYAATLVKYICDPRFPDLALSRVQNMTRMGSIPNRSQTNSLDELYSTILKNAFPTGEELTPDERENYLAIIHTIIVAGRPLTCIIISELLGINQSHVEATISKMQSVLYISDHLIYTFHASFADYIVTRARSDEMYCNEIEYHTLLSHATLNHMNNLRFNICDLPSSFLADKDVPGIEGRLKNIGDTLDYACTFWGYHIARSNGNENLMKGIESFVENKSVFWIEAMNLMKKLPVCQENIDYVLQNLKNGSEYEVKKKITDVKYVVELCQLSGSVVEATPHIYLSILPFCSEWLMNKIKLHDVMKMECRLLRRGAIHIWKTTYGVSSINLSCDGKTLVSGDDNGNIKLWDVFNGKEVDISIGGHDGSVRSVAFSADSTRIVSGSNDKTVKLWDTATGGQIGDPLKGHDECVNSVAFSADGTRIVSGSDDKTIRLWSTATGAQIGDPLQGHQHYVKSVAFSADGTRIVSGSSDQTIRLWDTATGAQIGDPLKGHDGWVNSVGFSADGTRIVSGSSDKTIRLWDTATGVQIGDPLQGHDDWVRSVAFSADGTRIVSGSDDNTIRFWETATGDQIGDPLQGHDQWVRSVAFSADGTRIVSGSDDKTIRLWDTATGAQIQDPLQGHDDHVNSVAFSADGTGIVSGSSDNTIRVWDTATGAQIGDSLQSYDGWVNSVAFSADGTRILSGSDDKTIRLWDIATGAQIGYPLQGHDSYVKSFPFSADSTRIVSGSSDMTIGLWDTATGGQIGDLLQGHDDLVNSVAFSADGTRIVSGSDDKTIRIWDTATGGQIGDPLQGHDEDVNSVAFSADGTRIVSGSDDKTIRLWDTATGAQIGDPLQGHDSYVNSVAFSADGTRIVSGSDDKTIRLWDTVTGGQIGDPLQGHDDYVNSVAFSADGTRIVSGSNDKTIRLWHVATTVQTQQSLQDTLSHVHFPDTNWKLSEDGWIYFPGQFQGVFWIPQQYRVFLWRSQNTCLISKSGYNKISFSNCVYGENWTKCVAS